MVFLIKDRLILWFGSLRFENCLNKNDRLFFGLDMCFELVIILFVNN